MSATANKETMGFQAEVNQLLQLMIHSLYSNKEIFLRELISNASDAADKLRFQSLTNEGLLEGDAELKIHIDFDKDAKTVTISDNGIGMSRDDVVSHLGTIAKSGTKEFLSSLSGDQTKDSNLIGQFGVGFYSSFIVADKVTVLTRKAGDAANQATRWESVGNGEFSIENVEKKDRGTTIILHIKSDSEEFVDAHRLRGVVSKYSDHIGLPIFMMQTETPSSEENKDEEKKPLEYEMVNKAKALWTMSKSEVKGEEYKEFYKHVSHDFAEPLTWMHNHVEGTFEYTSLLYLPGQAPFNLFEPNAKQGLKLYTKQVFIMDDADNLLPNYLRFVRGVVDANLPLNVSREILQENKLTKSISTGLVKRIFSTLESMAKNKPEDYTKFWSAFGNVLKEGPGEDFANKEKIAKLLRFASTHNDNADQTVSLEDYVSRMKDEQKDIYYISGETYDAVINSPHLEVFKKKGIEVLLLTDRIDEWLTSHLTEYKVEDKTYSMKSIAKGDLDLGDMDSEEDKKHQEEAEKTYESMLKQIKEVLGERVKEVKVTTHLTTSPACIKGDPQSMALYMQQMMKMAGQEMPSQPPTFEVNTDHALIQRLNDESDDTKFKAWCEILLDQAILAEGGQLKDPAGFVHKLNEMMLDLA